MPLPYNNPPSSPIHQHRSQQGFTLTELLVVLAIIGILVTLAAPSVMHYLRKNEARNIMRTLRPIFVEARVVALTRHQHVVICPSFDLIHCNKSAPHVLSFVDTNANLKREDAEIIINHYSPPRRYGQLRFNVGLGRSHIRYFPDTGKPRGYFANVTYCPFDGDLTIAKAIILNEHGRARFSFDKNGDGVHERGGGKKLAC